MRQCACIVAAMIPLLGMLYSEGVMARSTQVNKQQLLQEYRAAIQYSSNLSEQEKLTAKRRISELQAEAGSQARGDDVFDEKEVRVFRENITLYEGILKRNDALGEGIEGGDIILYQLARAYEGISDLDKAIAALERLVKDYPESEYVEEAVFRRAEMLFAQMEFERADAAYRDVLEYGADSGFYAFSLYKHGWSLFKQERYEGSISSFLKSLDFTIRELGTHNDVLLLGQLDEADRDLFFDTLRAISLSFSYMDDAMSITSHLALHSERRNEYLIYGNLGDLYLKKERYFEAAAVFMSFAEQHPMHILAPHYHIRSIEAARQGGFSTLVLEHKLAFVNLYRRNGAFWEKHSPKDNPKIVGYLQKSIQELAKHYHALAQLSKKPDDFQKAIDLYKRYIAMFQNAPDTAEINFTLAEALYENGKFDEAAAQYEKVAYEYTEFEQSAEAGYAALLALQKKRNGDASKDDTPSLNWLEKAQQFTQTYPDHPQAINVLLKAAEGFYAEKAWEQLADAEKSLLTRPEIKKQQRLTAMTMLAHAQRNMGLYKEAADNYLQVIELESDTKKKKDLRQWVASSYYKQGERAREQGELQQAVDYFMKVRKQVPGTDVQPAADYDAAVGLLKLKKWDQSVAVLERFQSDFPAHALQKTVPKLLATAYEQLQQPLKAAQQYISVAATDEELNVRQTALWNAAQIYWDNKQRKKSVALYKKYLKLFPDAFDEVVEIRHNMAEYQKKSGNMKAYREQLRTLVQYTDSVSDKHTNRSVLLTAQASLILANAENQKFFDIKLIKPLKKSMQKKRQALQEGVNRYQKVLDFKVAKSSTEATYRIAEMYRDFAQAITDSERPAGLSEEEERQYALLLEKQAKPYRQEAIRVHEINIRRGEEGIMTDFVRASRAVLDVLSARSSESNTKVRDVQ